MAKLRVMLPVLVFLACTIYAGRTLAAPDPPSPADLSVSPEDMRFYISEEPVRRAPADILVTIDVTVRNIGPKDSFSANASLFCDGNFLAMLPVPDIVAPANSTFVRFYWNTGGLAVGAHVVRVELGSAQDTNTANNNASADFAIFNPPTLNVTIDDPEREIPVDPSGKPVIVQFTGNVTVNGSTGGNLSVLLTATTVPTGESHCDPAEMSFGPGNLSQNFTLTTRSPNWFRQDAGWMVLLEANSAGEGHTAYAWAAASVDFLPNPVIIAYSDESVKDSVPGGKTEFSVRVENAGNRADSFDLSVLNGADLGKNGWNVTLSVHRVELEAHESTEVTVTAVFNGDWPPPDAFWPRYDHTKIVIRTSSTNGSPGTSLELYVKREGFNGNALLALTAGVAAATIFLILLPFRWPGRKRQANQTHVLGAYTAGVLLLTIGLFLLLLSQGLVFSYDHEEGGTMDYRSGVGPGVLVLPFILPLLLSGTMVGTYLFASEKNRGRAWPYLLILVIETIFIVGFIPYPYNYDHQALVGPDRGELMVTPLFNKLGPAFILMFCLLYILGLSFWYLLRPESWPFKGPDAGPKEAKAAD